MKEVIEMGNEVSCQKQMKGFGFFVAGLVALIPGIVAMAILTFFFVLFDIPEEQNPALMWVALGSILGGIVLLLIAAARN